MAVVGLAARGTQSKKANSDSHFQRGCHECIFSAIFGKNFQLGLIVVQNHICHGGFDNTWISWELLRGMLIHHLPRELFGGRCDPHWACFVSQSLCRCPGCQLPWESEQSVCGPWREPQHREELQSSGDSEEQNVPSLACKSQQFPDFFFLFITNSSRQHEIGKPHLLH